ncbi:Uncharacterized protein BP5553_01018 [Venustampulla echinocandica]|uniref:DUF7702 domain-containing protein n=1 Tax=Venustampulla echinocandica TaxID=2656787 RepID=A0A370TZT1_9HELO|nr:Uncharacterized protein BP5553_01018 [Venustampulla echinocandica]RDL41039.1 Uncharacterized protein BP5553_01018 [Venustampulla echinocandica]
MTGVNTAQLGVYAALSPPVIYVWIRHGKPGFLGWFYLFAFCSLRVVGGAMTLKNSKNSSASLISNIGLSPLLLATSGLLHEARHYRNARLRKNFEWTLVGLYHLLVAAGVGLVAAGASAVNKNSGTAPKQSDVTILKVGITTLLVSWSLVCIWAVFSLLPSQKTTPALGYIPGTKILFVVLLSLPFTGIRVLYSTVSIFSDNASLNPVTGSIGLRVGLSFIPELVSALMFILVGLATRQVMGIARYRGDGRGNANGMEADVKMGRRQRRSDIKGSDVGLGAGN